MDFENTLKNENNELETRNIKYFILNKSFLTHLFSFGFVGLGYFSPFYNSSFLNVGFYALSGSITNWLAIYMLFEKVPFLYGSGVIPNRFEDFKKGIRDLIMNEFFNRYSIKKFFAESDVGQNMDLTPIVNNLNYQKIFDGLVNVIMESSFGGMLGMFGGEKVLDQLRGPFEDKMGSIVKDMVNDKEFKKNLFQSRSGKDEKINQTVNQIEKIVLIRLEELTPVMVKNIIQRMIREHLGWLVVWGGVFGGVIGLIVSLLN